MPAVRSGVSIQADYVRYHRHGSRRSAPHEVEQLTKMRRMLLLSLALASLALPVLAQDASQDTPRDTAQDRPIRNAPSPRALELASYIYAASNVCGYRIGTSEFEALLAKQNAKPEDVSPRGPFANRLTGMFTLMSNQMALNREQACLAVASEYGPDGSVSKNVLLQPQAGDAPEPAKPAQ